MNKLIRSGLRLKRSLLNRSEAFQPSAIDRNYHHPLSSSKVLEKDQISRIRTHRMENENINCGLRENATDREYPQKTLTTGKPTGFNFYSSALNSPRFVVAPMVDGSELAWRILSRFYGAELCYTPMIHSALFSEPKNSKYRSEQFDLESGEEGSFGLDRPLIAQFCSNDPETLLTASNLMINPDAKSDTQDGGDQVLDRVDGFDLNLGCPQGIAKKGKYGAFLMDHLELVSKIISNLHEKSPLPITAKYRCFETKEATDAYTERLINAGAQILTIHGRTREQKGQFTGLADWGRIRSAVEIGHRHQIPVFGNGNVLTSDDALLLLEQTGSDGVMTAEGNLYNPAIFAPLNQRFIENYRKNLPQAFREGFDKIDEEYKDPDGLLGSPESAEVYPISTKVASQYLMICRTLKTRTATSAIKGHLYKIFRAVFETGRYNDIRENLSQISWAVKPDPECDSVADDLPRKKNKLNYYTVLDRFQSVVDSIKFRLESDRAVGLLNEKDFKVLSKVEKGEETTDYLRRMNIPYSRCQPYVRRLQDLPSKVLSRSSNNQGSISLIEGSNEESSDSVNPKLNVSICSNPEGCLNSGSAKCKWNLCKTCCSSKTSAAASKNRTKDSDRSGVERLVVEEIRDEKDWTLEGESKGEKTEEGGDQEDENYYYCEAHAIRAKLELEKKAFKAEKRKRRALNIETLRKKSKKDEEKKMNEEMNEH